MRSQVNLGQKENSNARNQYTNKAKQQNEIEAELVCDNCLNSNLIKQKKQVTNDETNNRPITPDFSQHEKLKMMMKHRISSEIEKRQLLSEKAARAFINYSEKDKLIQAQEGKNFSLIDGNKDLVKEKALNNYKKREMVISKSSKYIHSEKPEVKEYYEKCVEYSLNLINFSNYDQKEVFKGYKNPCIGKVNYVAELDSQVLSKQVKEEKKKFIDKKNDEEMIEKNKKILEEERRQMVIKKKKMQEEFLLDNKNLISMKNLKEDV